MHTQARSAAITLLTAAIMGLLSLNVTASAGAADLVRVTTSFDVKYASAVLRQVAHLFDAGFDRGAADRVALDIDSLKPDQTRVWQFTVQYQGKTQPLEVRALLDDLGQIDLDFATTPELARVVRTTVDGYLNSHGH